MHTGQTTHERARAHANMFAGCCYDPILLTFSFIGMSDVFAVASACCMTSTCAHAKRIMFGCPWPPANAVRCVGEIKWYTKLLLFALHSFIFVFLRLPVFFLNLCSMSLKRRLHRHFFIRSICSSLYIYIYIYALALCAISVWYMPNNTLCPIYRPVLLLLFFFIIPISDLSSETKQK